MSVLSYTWYGTISIKGRLQQLCSYYKREREIKFTEDRQMYIRYIQKERGMITANDRLSIIVVAGGVTVYSVEIMVSYLFSEHITKPLEETIYLMTDIKLSINLTKPGGDNNE